MGHLPGGLDDSEEENIAEEIREEHVILVQKSNNDIPLHDPNGAARHADWAFWQRENYEFQSEESISRVPIGWYESSQWAFVLTLFHHVLFVLQVSVADLHLGRSPVLAIKYMSYIMRGKTPQSRIKLFTRYSVRYFLQRRIPLMKRLGLILYFLQQLSSFRGVQTLDTDNWIRKVNEVHLLQLVEEQNLAWMVPNIMNCKVVCPHKVMWADCSPGMGYDWMYSSEYGRI